MENSTGIQDISTKSDPSDKHPRPLSLQECKNIILSKLKQGKFVLPPSVLRNHGKLPPPITFRVPQFDMKRKRPTLIYSQQNLVEKRETRSQRLRRHNEMETNRQHQAQGEGSQLKESTNTVMITAKDKDGGMEMHEC